jgi:hypothetical protein
MRLSAKHLSKLIAASRVGKPMWFKDKKTGEREIWGTLEDEVFIIVADYKHMIRRIYFNRPAQAGYEYGYGTAYYTLDKDGRNAKFGQYASATFGEPIPRTFG